MKKKCYIIAQLGGYEYDSWIVCGVFSTKENCLKALAFLKQKSPRYGIDNMVVYQVDVDHIVYLTAGRKGNYQLVARTSWNDHDEEWVDTDIG